MCYRITVYDTNSIMAGLKIFFVVVMVLVSKDGAFSCSLRSHKYGSTHPCLSSTSDLTSIPHPTPVLKSHTISPPCDSSSSPSSSNIHAHGVAISSTPTLYPDMSSPGSTPFIPPTPTAPSDNKDILNSLIKLFSSPAFSTSQTGNKAPTLDQSILSFPSTSTGTKLPTSVPHTKSSPCASGSVSSSSSSILQSSYGLVPTILSNLLSPLLPYSAPTHTSTKFLSSNTNPDPKHFSLEIPSSIPSKQSSSIFNSKSMLFSPPYPLFVPTVIKNVVPGTKPCAMNHPVGPPLSILPSVPRGPSLPFYHPVPKVVPVPTLENSPAHTPAPSLELGPETPPEEFPATVPSSNVPVSIPVTSTSTQSSFSGYNPAFINLLYKLLMSSQAQTSPSSSPPIKTPSMPTSNATAVSAPDIKPHTILPACATPSGSSSACLSSVLPKTLNGSISNFHQMLMSMTPSPTSGISSGYNPEFMKLLIKHFLFNQTSSLPPFSSLFPLIQTKLNTTSIVPLTHNLLPTSTINTPLSELNPNVFNISSNNTFHSAPAGSENNQNISISNNQYLANILVKLLSSSNASKTSLLPCESSSSTHSISTLNTTPILSVPCIPPLSSLPDILGKFPSLTTVTNLSFPYLIPSPVPAPLPSIKQFPERVQILTPASTPTPILYPLSPSSDISPCHLKHKEPLQLSSSTLTVNPCFQHVKKSHIPHFPSPCLLSPIKSSSGCEHLSPTT